MTQDAPVVVVVRDAAVLAEAVAARLVTRLVDAQAERGSASVVLTGGGIGTAVLEALRGSPARAAVDWPRLDVWWGDERFLPAGSPDRNDLQARTALLDHVDVDPARVHPMPAAGGAFGDDADEAAAAYAELLASAAPHGRGVPLFDVLLLGMGADGHTASVFPEAPAVHDARPVLAVHGAPKPPPTRITLGPSVLAGGARECWVLVSGEEKAPMVATALSGAGPLQVPVAGARGRTSTLWLLDEAAASRLPKGLRRL